MSANIKIEICLFNLYDVMKTVVVAKIRFALHGIVTPPTVFITSWGNLGEFGPLGEYGQLFLFHFFEKLNLFI